MRPVTTLFCSLLLGACSAQDRQKQEKPEVSAAIKQFLATLKKEGIELDRKKRTLSIPAYVNRPTNDLEFLLIHPRGKTHESLLVTPATPSVINSGLIALGLKKGENATFKKKVPEPTEAEQRKGVAPYVLVPPSGTSLYMTVSFKDKAGKTVELAVEDLLLDWTANLSVTENQWIFLGGRFAQMYRNEPEVFMADFEGNLISVCYKHPANHLFTMRHARAQDEMNWSIAAACPPPGTKLRLIFHVDKPAVVAAREQRMRKAAAARKQSGDNVDLSSRPARKGKPSGDTKAPAPEKNKNEKNKNEKNKNEKNKKSDKSEQKGKAPLENNFTPGPALDNAGCVAKPRRTQSTPAFGALPALPMTCPTHELLLEQPLTAHAKRRVGTDAPCSPRRG